MVDTLLVTGIHREELDFGDQVATLLDREKIELIRIPQGISHERKGNDPFYYNICHREIYLQLRQQIKSDCRLLIDLHCGLNEVSRCADGDGTIARLTSNSEGWTSAPVATMHSIHWDNHLTTSYPPADKRQGLSQNKLTGQIPRF